MGLNLFTAPNLIRGLTIGQNGILVYNNSARNGFSNGGTIEGLFYDPNGDGFLRLLGGVALILKNISEIPGKGTRFVQSVANSTIFVSATQIINDVKIKTQRNGVDDQSKIIIRGVSSGNENATGKYYLANTGALTGAEVTALTSTDIDNYINDGTFVEYLDNKNQLESYEIDTDATGQSDVIPILVMLAWGNQSRNPDYQSALGDNAKVYDYKQFGGENNPFQTRAWLFSYLRKTQEVYLDTSTSGVTKDFSFDGIDDADITETDRSMVQAYTRISNTEELYDYTKYYQTNSFDKAQIIDTPLDQAVYIEDGVVKTAKDMRVFFGDENGGAININTATLMIIETPRENGNPKFIANKKTVFGLVEDTNSGGSDNILFVGRCYIWKCKWRHSNKPHIQHNCINRHSISVWNSRYKIRWNTWKFIFRRTTR